MQHLYVDGGVIGKNPSSLGATWAWCLVEDDRFIRGDSGVITPEMIGLPAVSNNISELWAAVVALEAMPELWLGRLWTDSEVTRKRLRKTNKRFTAVPDFLVQRTLAVRGKVAGWTRLIGSHPTRAEMEVGHKASGVPVSKWNVWCDHQCYLRSRDFARRAACG